jgi:hypothetical protein
MQPGSRIKLSSLSPCPFWTKPITQVGLLRLTTIQTRVRLPAHMPLISTGFDVGFDVTAFPFPLQGLMVGRYPGECASLLHQKGKNFTCTRTKLSKTFWSSLLIPDYKSHFEETDRTHSCRSAITGSTLAARRAGNQQAASAASSRIRLTQANVGRSAGFTP